MKDNLEWIKQQIRYEERDGVHTYHKCKCGKPCRSIKCADCWRKEALELIEKLKKEEVKNE